MADEIAAIREALWTRVRHAWDWLASRDRRDIRPGRPRERGEPRGDEPELERTGFADEALPWLDAVFRFSLRLTRGDRDAAEDLVQETFLRAYRFWHTYRPGTNAKSWLFTICRNTYLHGKQRASTRHETALSGLDTPVDELTAESAFRPPVRDPEAEYFGPLIDDEVIAAIDALPPDFRDVLVLSDLGDLKYTEIAEILDIPVGTAKSRLFRARRILQDRLRGFAEHEGYVEGDRP